MSKRKYQYNEPKNTREHIEAIYEEINFSERGKRNYTQDFTIKDLLTRILSTLREEIYKKNSKKEDERYALSASKTILVLVGITLIFCGKADNDLNWISNNWLAIKLWGIALTSLFIGISLEDIDFFKRIWSFGVTKVISTLAVSGLFIFCTGKASSLINGVFHVDASALPYTRTFVSGFMFFEYISPLIVVVILIIVVFYVLSFISWISQEGDKDYFNFPYFPTLFTLASVVLLVVTINFMRDNFTDFELPVKIYKLGHALDFNEKYTCSNIPEGYTVLFLGDRQDRVLVDYGSPGSTDMDKIIGGRGSFVTMNDYKILPCDDSKQTTYPLNP